MTLQTTSHFGDVGMPLIRPNPKENKYETSGEWTYKIVDRNAVYMYTVPHAFLTDGASIPRWLWSISGNPWTPDFCRASLLHDYLYQNNPGKVGKKKADKLFYEILKIDGVSKFRAGKMYTAVKLGGGFAWRKHRSNDKKRMKNS